MIKYILIFFPVFIFADNKLHDEYLKGRTHHTLGYGVSGSVALSDGDIFVGQTGSTLNNGSVYIYSFDSVGQLVTNQIFPNIENTIEHDFGFSISVDKILPLYLIKIYHQNINI